MTIPRFDVDLIAPEIVAEPFEAYRLLRDIGPVCEMPRYGLYAMGRHADVKAALGNWEVFSSADGVALNDICNGFMAGTPIGSDPPNHTRFRDLLARPLAPRRLVEMRGRLAELASERVREVVGSGPIDAMELLARHLPLRVISELVGLPEEGRQRMLGWANAGFNSMGAAAVPDTGQALATMGEMIAFISDPELPARMREGSWAAELWAAVACGELTAPEAQAILQGYVTPSLDTTIYTLGTILWLLAGNPNQWALLKANPTLITRCINEALRIEGPARGFSRVTRRDHAIGDCTLPAGSRVMTVLPAANRDERRYADPDRFDITRDASDHLGFGSGIHRCVGANIAMLELTVMLEAIVREVDAIELIGAVRANSMMLRGFERLDLRLIGN
ncbi:cytochrome P450 [Novosphingobium sp. PASSN1]|uniref:cytochrome P450 n=1 Tax=Novosphingobium sp. PASSN1 TaxID=2015561 RepID=UPI000BC4E0D1|nr:cytochrome P450 [Novosphingobium sp. PASSN1]OYU34497.1 MAG: cytochrome [Novosphingobium sp. PASSN1]